MYEAFQILAVELVVVDEGGEAVAMAVPEVPDEGAVAEEPAVLGEEHVAEPAFEAAALDAGVFEQVAEGAGRPAGAVGGAEEGRQAVGGGALTSDGREADDAVLVGEVIEFADLLNEGAGLVCEFHVGILLRRPAVTDEPGDGHLKWLGGVRWMAVEEPLGGVIGIGFREVVGVLFFRYFLPVFQVEGVFDQ